MAQAAVFEMAPKLYEPIDDPNVVKSNWFKGHINRAEAEALILGEGLPGNFLVRQKDKSNRLFAHSYLSKSQGKVVHNLIELREDGQWLVDDKMFSGTTLDMVVDKIQRRLREWRKMLDVDPATRQQVEACWPTIYHPNWQRPEAVDYLDRQPPGSFVIRSSTTPGAVALSVRRPDGFADDAVWNGPIFHSEQGHYLQFSEMIGKTLVDLIGSMLVNTERVVAAGIPTQLVLPPVPTGGAVHGAAARKAYEVASDENYDEINHGGGAAGADAEYGDINEGGHGLAHDMYSDINEGGQLPTPPPAGDDDILYDDIDDGDRQRASSTIAVEANVMYGAPDEDDAAGPPPPPRPPSMASASADPIIYGDDADACGSDYTNPPPPRPPKTSSLGESDFIDVGDLPPPRPAKPAAEEIVYGDPDDPPPPRHVL